MPWATSKEWSGEKIGHVFGEKTRSEQGNIAVLQRSIHMERRMAAWLRVEHDRPNQLSAVG